MVLVLAVCLGLGCDDSGSHTPEPSVDLAGFHRIEVDLGDVRDDLWIYVAHPADWTLSDGLVAYGHGQGLTNLLPCSSGERPPTHDDVAPTVALMDHFATQGYLGVATFYRASGTSAGLPGLKLRDANVRDAAALLAGAQWVRRTAAAERPVPTALLGTSMGAMAAFAASSKHPSLAALQEGLDLRVTVLAGFTLNLMANVSRNLDPVGDISAATPETIGALSYLAAYQVGQAVPELSAASLASPAVRLLVESLVTPAGEHLLLDLYATPVSCTRVGPAVCGCGSSVFETRWRKDAPEDFAADTIDVATWFPETAIEAWTHWARSGRPPTAAEREANPALRALADASLLYDTRPIRVPRVVPLISQNDHVTNGHGERSTLDLIARLQAAGVLEGPPPPIASDARGVCGHSDYFLPERPDCGYRAVLDALRTELVP